MANFENERLKPGDGERLDRVNDRILLIQNEKLFRFGTDALLLAGFIDRRKRQRGAELGAGSGIISLLCASRGRFDMIHTVEYQEYFAMLTERNVALNGLSDRIFPHRADVRDTEPNSLGGEFDAVFSNPPYMKSAGGKINTREENFIARHEAVATVFDFCACAARLLKHGGTFYTVYRPDRLTELICALRGNRLEPKRMTFVSPDPFSAPSLVLIASKYGAEKDGLVITAPFCIYSSDSEDRNRRYSEQMEFLLENGYMGSKEEYKSGGGRS